jgi:type I site-specific restriction endonuclease
MTTEQDARGRIDQLLGRAGWVVCDPEAANIHAGRGVTIRKFPLKAGHGFADYLLYVDSQAAGVVKAKKGKWSSPASNPTGDARAELAGSLECMDAGGGATHIAVATEAESNGHFALKDPKT